MIAPLVLALMTQLPVVQLSEFQGGVAGISEVRTLVWGDGGWLRLVMNPPLKGVGL